MSMELVVALSTMFVAVALLSGAGASWVLWSSEQRHMRQALEGGTGVLLVQPETGRDSADRKRLGRFLAKSDKELAAARSRLARAGFQQPWAATVFSVCEKVALVAFGVPPLLLAHGSLAWLYAAIAAAIGYMLPGFILEHLVKRRTHDISNGLPDALDLLVLCLEAGVSLNQAIVRATGELEIAYPVLAEELRIVITEIRAGKTRIEALKGFEKRTKLDDVRALVSMLAQTERFGTSVAQALRTLASVGRTKRRQLAEERAGKLGVKLVFPLVFFIFPALYVVMLGSAALKLIHSFSH
jgi:tight adherence protein C